MPYRPRRSLFFKARQKAVEPQKTPRKRKRQGLLPFVWKSFKMLCLSIGFMIVVSGIMGALFSNLVLKEGRVGIPQESVLLYELVDAPLEHPNEAGPYAFEDPVTIRQLTTALEDAKTDPRINGLVLSMRGGRVNLAHIQELRAAVKDFRTSGKFAYIYATSYGEMGSGLGQYYLASAFDKIFMQPIGSVNVSGLFIEIPYARALLDKIGIEPQIEARKEYKSVFSSVTDTEITKPVKEMMTALLKDINDKMLADIAEDRSFLPDYLQRVVDQGLFTDQQAVEKQLVDELIYKDDLSDRIKQNVAGEDGDVDDVRFVQIDHYIAEMTHQRREKALAAIKHQQAKPSVALIYAVGAIVESADMSPSGLSSADDVAGMIQAATEDEDIEAIVLRISSPGGSPVASETIRRAIIDAKEEGKIVIVSMGEMAASGGYWIAANADYIYALPGTLTGSIGVAGGKFSLGNMWSKVGVNWASIGFSENADLWSFNQPFSAEGRARFENVIDMIYDAFIARVAEGRGMSVDDAEQIARGRVWSGYQALDVGLVDELGGLNDALDYAGSRLGGEDRHDIRVVMLPSVKTPFERVLQMLEGQVRAGQGLHVLGQYISANDQLQAQALLESLQQSGKINTYQSPLYLR